MPKRPFYRLSEQQVKDALQETKGLIKFAAKKLNCSHQAIENRIRKSPELQEFVRNCREEVIDLAEHKLFQAIENGEQWAVSMILKNYVLGRSRGYGDAQEINMNANVNANVDLSVLSVEELKQLNELVSKTSDNKPS